MLLFPHLSSRTIRPGPTPRSGLVIGLPIYAVPRAVCALPTHRSADAIGFNSVHGSSVALREFCLLGGAGRPGSAMMRAGLGLGVGCKIVVGRRTVDRLPCATLACIRANIRLKRRIEAVVDFLIEIKAAALIPSVVYAGPGTIPTRIIAQCGAAYVAVPKPRFLRSLGRGLLRTCLEVARCVRADVGYKCSVVAFRNVPSHEGGWDEERILLDKARCAHNRTALRRLPDSMQLRTPVDGLSGGVRTMRLAKR